MAEHERISADDVKKRMDSDDPPFLIDARDTDDWKESDIKMPGAIRMHSDDLPEHLDEIPHDRLIVTYCS